ncbi:MAG: hypothetical protein IT324_16170 [Anaerolineae bacterium]|nr:hypothetical protein [Anaerolineae bacterium]
MNIGGWLLLTVIFSALLLIVQRSERKRRQVTVVIMAIVGLVVWRYAMFRMTGDCEVNPALARVCSLNWLRDRAAVTAINTVNWSLVVAVVFNAIFWVFIGRSNPPGSSDSIKVLGMND